MSRLTYAVATGMILFFLFSEKLEAQTKPESYKFKAISIKEMEMTSYPHDTSAEAVVLGDIGQSNYEYDDVQGFILIFTRQVRIKILKQSGTHYANQQVSLYMDTPKEEKLLSVKGSTYNLVDGKITETKLKDDGIFAERVNNNWMRKKITMPNVREGSIIDLKYTIKSPFFWLLPSWTFQSEIPVQWSEYEVIIPEYFHFSPLVRGYVGFVINEKTTGAGTISLSGIKREGEGVNTRQSFEKETINFTQYEYRLATQNVPAMKEEPYVTSIDNYLSSVEFELESYQFPMKAQIDLTTTWEKIAELMLQDGEFGEQLKKGGVVKDVAATINATASVPFDKMVLGYDWVKNNMKWNEINSEYPTTNLREARDKKSGNSGDINLMLILLLKELGLNAEPVVLSTRKHGELRENHPVSSKLNYVIAWVKIDDKEYLLDATDIDRPYNILPFRCLNGKGLLVVRDTPRWINLLTQEKTTNNYYADIKLLPDGIISGTFEVSSAGYAALDERDEFIRLGKEEYENHLKEHQKTWEIEELMIENMDDLAKPVKKKYVFSSEEITNPGNNLIYLNTLLDEGQKTNPFQLENREYPVDFGAPVKDVYTVNIELPEGYTVESLPEPAKLVLIDQAGSYKYLAAVTGNRITISSTLSINRTLYLQEEYKGLREFFNMLIKKQAQQIVIKKT